MKLGYTPFLTAKPSTSGASRKKIVPSFSNCIILKYKKLLLKNTWSSGRGSTGRLIAHSKGRRILKSRDVIYNRSYRDTSISFVGGFVVNPYHKNVSSTIFSSSGNISIVPSSETHKVLSLTYLKSLFDRKSTRYNAILSVNNNLLISAGFFLIFQLPKQSQVSNLEVQPLCFSSISRSPGSHAKLLKVDPRTSLSLVKLPSGVKKIISIFSVGSLGRASLIPNSVVNITSSRSSLISGKAPRSRGVAKNPVDHPHGGRTKAIKYPRTPWGLTTKFK